MSDPKVVWHDHSVTRDERERLNDHRGCVVWFTGLSGSGKSTVANIVEQNLYHAGVRTYLLDGDNIRHGLNATPQILAERHTPEFAERFGLGFGQIDREENIRRIGAVAQLFCDAGVVTLTAFVSPYRRDRDAVRKMLAPGDFIEVFVDTPLEVCESRDPKGLYKKARAGELKQFTGIDDPYEPPTAAELVLPGGELPAEELADRVVEYLRTAGKLGGPHQGRSRREQPG
jgi:adenylylsulfate kinase